MKKLLVVLLVVIISQTVLAQKNVSFGPSVGFGHAWLSGVERVAFKPGVNVGATLIYSPAEHWGLGGDVRFSFMEGVRTKSENDGTEFETSLSATYLRIPLKVTHFFGNHGDRFRPKLFVGPSFGFLLGGNTKQYVNDDVISESKTKDHLETFDFGFIAGAGLNYRIKSETWLNIDMAYQNGLLDATKAQSYNTTRNIGLNVGITFPLGTVVN